MSRSPPSRHASCPPRVMTIAGSDSGAGAGIQADLKAIAALGAYGTSCITALTAQNTLGVQAVQGVSSEFVVQQIQSVVEDIGIDAIKRVRLVHAQLDDRGGMLYSAETIRSISEWLRSTFATDTSNSSSSSSSSSTAISALPPLPPFVLDPVCVSTSGHQLLPLDALDSLKSLLLPLALVITPNVPEAELLTGSPPDSIQTLDDMRRSARQLGQMGVRWVYLKGGHVPFEKDGIKVVVDLLWDAKQEEEVVSERKWSSVKNTHGTGCTLSSAIAVHLAQGKQVPEAVRLAADYVAVAIATAHPLGSGSGPVNHFHALGPRSLPLPTELSPTPFTDFLISYSPSTWSSYVNHPFPRSLADGTCPLPSFLEFISQDYHFLLHYARTNALMAYKSSKIDEIKASTIIVDAVVRETEMHIKYCETYGIPRSTLQSIPESLANLAYNRFVLDTCSKGDLLEARVVTAPCLIGYGVVGKTLCRASEAQVEGNRYWGWIKEYGSEWYQGAVKTGIDLLETTLAESPISSQRLIELAESFKTATILEVAFWDAAVAARGDQKKWDKLASQEVEQNGTRL